jgi:membrane protein
MPLAIKKIVDFLERDIWRIPVRKLPRRRSFLIQQLRVIVLAVREFRGNQCQLNASALTFYTLISIVPIMAMAFGIAKGFGLEKTLETQLLDKFPGQEDILGQIIGFANNLLADTSGGVIAGVGVILLFWTVIKVLNSIETSFNDIWGVKVGRPLGRKISDYLSIMMICPFFLVASGGVTVFVASQIQMIVDKLVFLGPLAPVILLSLKLLPFVMLWLLFSFLYLFMPNTRVNLFAGITGGVIAGTIYQLVQMLYIHFQIGVGKMNVIYGSFAALPLFLVWLQLSWRIVLFGAEVSFAQQNADTYEFEHDCLEVSPAFKKLLSLRIASLVIGRFAAGQMPLTTSGISDVLDIPVRLVRTILFELTGTGILAELRDAANKESSFHPARDIHQITIQFVIDALENKGTDNIPVLQDTEFLRLKETLGGFSQTLRQSPANRKLMDISLFQQG